MRSMIPSRKLNSDNVGGLHGQKKQTDGSIAPVGKTRCRVARLDTTAKKRAKAVWSHGCGVPLLASNCQVIHRDSNQHDSKSERSLRAARWIDERVGQEVQRGQHEQNRDERVARRAKCG